MFWNAGDSHNVWNVGDISPPASGGMIAGGSLKCWHGWH